MIEVAGVLLKQAGEYVLQHRDDFPHIADSGMYSLWGGRIESDDPTPLDAAVRELHEETGIVISKEQLDHLISYDTKGKGATNFDKPVMVHLYFVEIAEGEVVECFEGQGIIRAKSLADMPADKISEFLKKAIELHEQTR